MSDKNLNTNANAVDIGSEADVDAIMKKYDRESNTRVYTGIPKLIVRYLFVAFALFVVGMNLFATWDERIRRTSFLGCIILLVFIMYPIRKGNPGKPNHIPFYDIILMVLGSGSFFYYTFNCAEIIKRSSRITDFQILVGVVGILILFEACRRVVGLPIIFVAAAFVIYAFTQSWDKPMFGLKSIIYQLFYTTNGVIGTPINVCATFIVLFIIFGAFLEATGISQFFIQCANAIAGASTGGPAKVAVISSALCGMVSGSSVGNTVTTGSITIPLMKKTGFPSEFAGAVEAAASTGGQIMPPIMGAAAFLMAEMCGVPYTEIAVKAILPAILYFAGIFLMVHFQAKKRGLEGLKREDLPKFRNLIVKIYLLIPLVLLVVIIMKGFTMSRAAVLATASAIAVSLINTGVSKVTKQEDPYAMTPKSFFDALENGAKNTLSVAVSCGMAGIIAGVVTMTGLGAVLVSAITTLANGHLLIALFLTMITCIILGMGLPTTATYIIMATTCAPILVNGMGLNLIAANMFVFYFGIVADITPPVALAAYAGSAIAKASPMKTALNASKLAIAAFIIPYVFSLDTAMLFIDTTPIQVAIICVTSLVGMLGLASGIEGFLLSKMNVVERLVAIAAGLCLIFPGIATDLVGLVAIAGIVVIQLGTRKKATA
ncbi:MAG: TRAP transporter permease [Muricoprocola sp.]